MGISWYLSQMYQNKIFGTGNTNNSNSTEKAEDTSSTISENGEDRTKTQVKEYVDKLQAEIGKKNSDLIGIHEEMMNLIVPTPPSEKDFEDIESYKKAYDRYKIEEDDYNNKQRNLQLKEQACKKDIDNLNRKLSKLNMLLKANAQELPEKLKAEVDDYFATKEQQIKVNDLSKKIKRLQEENKDIRARLRSAKENGDEKSVVRLQNHLEKNNAQLDEYRAELSDLNKEVKDLSLKGQIINIIMDMKRVDVKSDTVFATDINHAPLTDEEKAELQEDLKHLEIEYSLRKQALLELELIKSTLEANIQNGFLIFSGDNVTPVNNNTSGNGEVVSEGQENSFDFSIPGVPLQAGGTITPEESSVSGIIAKFIDEKYTLSDDGLIHLKNGTILTKEELQKELTKILLEQEAKKGAEPELHFDS